ncbi:MAG TPA: hypothetical protein VFM18_18935 [Methanosarcina sp.]|nr:hypothetical protein [Methanosarcina sp.]
MKKFKTISVGSNGWDMDDEDYNAMEEYHETKDYTVDIDDLMAERLEFEKIAIEAMRELEANGHIEVILLRNNNIRKWWCAIKEVERKKKVKADALAKLSDEEKELLGLR